MMMECVRSAGSRLIRTRPWWNLPPILVKTSYRLLAASALTSLSVALVLIMSTGPTLSAPCVTKSKALIGDDPVPNRRLCALLRKQQRAAVAVTTISNVDAASATLVTPTADRKPKPEPTHNPKTSSASGCSNSVARLPDSPSSIETESAISATRKRQPNAAKKAPQERRKKKAASSVDDDACKVGDRVYCRWPQNDRYYWGHISEVHSYRHKPTCYKVCFCSAIVIAVTNLQLFLTLYNASCSV